MTKSRFRWIGLVYVAAFLLLELAVIHISRHMAGFECHVERYAFCDWARNILLAAYSLAAVFVLLGVFAPDVWRRLLCDAGLHVRPLLINLAGLALLIASLPLLRQDLSSLALTGLTILWIISGCMVLGGALTMLAPGPRWRQFLSELGWHLPLVLLVGLAAPFAALAVRPFWKVDTLADWTFALVVRIMGLWRQPVETDPVNKVIGAGEFYVDVAPSCSGIEGLVLTTVFSLIFMGLFRADLRFPHALLILPLALLASWLLNALRIAVLLQIGISGHPDLAVGGFHSHAGWLMFTMLSLCIVLVAHAVPFWRAARETTKTPTQVPPFLQDPAVAQILPFAVFMGTALLLSTFTADPGLWYPLRAAVMALVLGLVWRHIRALPWRLDPVALVAGLAIAALWIVAAPEAAADAPAPFAALGGFAAMIWIATRVIGTSLLVPVIEELFFRGYLMDRLAPSGAPVWRAVLAIAVTSGLFALLHDRWIEAAIAGVIFALLTLRSRNLTDAIIAHALANALIAVWAMATGNWAAV